MINFYRSVSRLLDHLAISSAHREPLGLKLTVSSSSLCYQTEAWTQWIFAAIFRQSPWWRRYLTTSTNLKKYQSDTRDDPTTHQIFMVSVSSTGSATLALIFANSAGAFFGAFINSFGCMTTSDPLALTLLSSFSRFFLRFSSISTRRSLIVYSRMLRLVLTAVGF